MFTRSWSFGRRRRTMLLSCLALAVFALAVLALAAPTVAVAESPEGRAPSPDILALIGGAHGSGGGAGPEGLVELSELPPLGGSLRT